MLKDGSDVRGVVGLESTDNNIFASFTPATPLVQHLKRLADPTRITQKDLQLPALAPALFHLDFGEQLVRAAAAAQAFDGIVSRPQDSSGRNDRGESADTADSKCMKSVTAPIRKRYFRTG